MNKLNYDLRSKGKEYIFFITESYEVGIRRNSDGIVFLSNLSPFHYAAYMLSCLTEQMNGIPNYLIDQQAKIIKEDNNTFKKPAIMLIRPTAGSKENFPFKSVPALITCQSYEKNSVSFNIPLTAFDIMSIVALMKECMIVPTSYVIAGTIFFYHDGNSIFVQVGGSESIEIDEESRKSLCHLLRRWVSGQYTEKYIPRKADNQKNENQRTRVLIYNKNGLLFRGSDVPRLICHGISTPPLTYRDVVELLLVLEVLRGKEIEKETSKQEKLNNIDENENKITETMIK